MRRLLCAPLILVLGGCERVVGIDLPEGDRRLVIEARIERVQGMMSGSQRFRLSTTDAFFSGQTPPGARGAIVMVSDDAGRTVPFTESSSEPGIYETSALSGEVGRVYTLTIDFQGERYQATERLLAVAPIDAFYFANRTRTVSVSDGLRATIDFRDPAGVRNFYLWDQVIDGVRLVSADSTAPRREVGSDEFQDGRAIREFQPYEEIGLTRGQIVTMRQIALSEQSYRYYLALSDQTENDGSPFSVALASVRGNVANITVPSHLPLGYFMVGEVAEVQGRVP